jgi:ABC-type bacteriocin/lantibiotic exporter with double-glycine peptidase domain
VTRACLRIAFLAALAGGCASWGSVPERLHREPGWRAVPDVHAFAQTGQRDCGTAALASVLHHWEPALDLEAVRRLTGPPDANGITAGRLRAVARDRGLRAYLVPGSLADLDRELAAGRPVLVGLVRSSGRTRVAHYEVVAGYHPGKRLVLAADPARGWTTASVDDFLAEWEPARRLILVVSR